MLTRRSLLKTGAAAAASALALPALARGGPIRIGYVSPQSGPLSAFAQADANVIGTVVESAAAQGIAVEGIVKDCLPNPNRAAEVARELHLIGVATPPDAAFSVVDWTAFVIVITVIGGIGTLPGPVVGVVVFSPLQRALADYSTVYLIILGLIGIAVMLFARKGIWGVFTACTGIERLPLRHPAPRRAR